MKNVRRYGNPPYRVALIHGGPGVAGEMAPVARALESEWGVLEPLQTARSIEGQIKELKDILEKNGDPPITLVGFSWGAWLGFLFAAKNPTLVSKLILIGSGGFKDEYASKIQETRIRRLSESERTEVKSLIEILNSPRAKNKKRAFIRYGELFSKADAYDPILSTSEVTEFQVDIFQNIWKEAEELRKSGKLLEIGKKIKCSVVAIHGDYDPHPVEGVQKPLSAILKDFRVILITRCGHKPWIERQAKDRFYFILKEEIGQGNKM